MRIMSASVAFSDCISSYLNLSTLGRSSPNHQDKEIWKVSSWRKLKWNLIHNQVSVFTWNFDSLPGYKGTPQSKPQYGIILDLSSSFHFGILEVFHMTKQYLGQPYANREHISTHMCSMFFMGFHLCCATIGKQKTRKTKLWRKRHCFCDFSFVHCCVYGCGHCYSIRSQFWGWFLFYRPYNQI